VTQDPLSGAVAGAGAECLEIPGNLRKKDLILVEQRACEKSVLSIFGTVKS